MNGYPYMLWAAVGIHSLIGAALILSPSSTQNVLVVSGLNTLLEINTGSEYQVIGVGVVLETVSTLAAWGLLREKYLSRSLILGALIPQYLILLLSLVSTIVFIAKGEYQDQMFDRWSIAAATAATIVVATLHTLQILDRYAVNWHRTRRRMALIHAYDAMSIEGQIAVSRSLGIEGT